MELYLHFPVSLNGVQEDNFTFLLLVIIEKFLLSNSGPKPTCVLYAFLCLP